MFKLRLKHCFLSLVLLLGLGMPHNIMSQTISGVVVDKDNETVIPDATIGIESTKISVLTNNQGEFEIPNAPTGEQILLISAEGFESIQFAVDVPTSGIITIPQQSLIAKGSAIGLEQADIPTISLTSDELENDDDQAISGVLSASRDAFLNAAAFTFGSTARFRTRGYNSEHSEVLINGLVMNGLENGRVFYGAWGGLNDVFRNRTSYHGTTATNYSFGGIGGLSNIDVSASNQRKQLRVSYSISNRSYRNRLMATYSTGKMSNGWAFSAAASKRWADEGYIEATPYDAYAYFLAAEKELNAAHAVGLTVFGAPTERGQGSGATKEMSIFANDNYYNSYWGFQAGEKRNSRISNTHLPTAIAHHSWKIDDRSNLNSAASFQTGKSGRTRLDWFSAQDPRADYYRNLPSFAISNGDLTQALIIGEALKSSQANRQINWDRLYNSNYNENDTLFNANGVSGAIHTGKWSSYILEERRNDPTRINLSTTYQRDLTEIIAITGGIHYRNEKEENYKLVHDLLGGDFFVDIDNFAIRDFGESTDQIQNDLDRPNRVLSEGDRYGYDYDANISTAKFWAQSEFKLPKYDLFVAGNLSSTKQWREGHVRNGRFPMSSLGESEKLDFFNYGIKGGATYKIDGRNYLYANGQYQTKAPLFRNSFVSVRSRNQTVANIEDEVISSIEGGYLLRAPFLKARATAYLTEFSDQTSVSSGYLDIENAFVSYVITGIDQEHKGVELAIEGKVSPELTAIGVASLGQYIYTSRPNLLVIQDNIAAPLNEELVYQKNFYIPGTPQKALTAALNYRGKEYWFANINFNFFDDIYIDFDEIRRTELAVEGINTETIQGQSQYNEIIAQQKAADAFTMDFFGGKSFKINDNFIYLNVGVNNILNNTNLVTGGYEPRLRFNRALDDPNFFGPTLYHSYGTNYFINVSFRH